MLFRLTKTLEYQLPEQLKDLIGEDCYQKKQSFSIRLKSLGVNPTKVSGKIKQLKQIKEFREWFNEEEQKSLRHISPKRVLTTKDGLEFVFPDQWKDCLGDLVLKEEMTVAFRLKQLGFDPKHIGRLIDTWFMPIQEFRDWYDKEKQKDLRTKQAISTNFIKYGVSSPSKTEKVRNKIKRTNLIRYGFTSSAKNEEVKKKRQETTKKNMGVINPFMSLRSQEKCINTRYPYLTFNKATEEGMLNYLKAENISPIREIPMRSVPFKGKCLVCGRISEFHFTPEVTACPFCNKSSTIFERKVSAFLSDKLGLKVEPHNRTILEGREIDIYLPDLKIGFEINGALTHNSGFSRFGAKPKSRNYHSNKTEEALKAGVKLFHIWEDYNQDILMSVIKAKLKVFDKTLYARKLCVKEVSWKEVNEFYQRAHLLGSTSSTFSIALTDGNSIVQAVSVLVNGEVAVITRNASELNTSVLGGFNRILKRVLIILKNRGVKKLITYAQRDLTPVAEDSIYSRAGFKFMYDAGPTLYYYVYRSFISAEGKYYAKGIKNRQSFMKHKLSMFNGTKLRNGSVFNLDTTLTEQENLSLLQIYPIYNSGCFKFELNIE